jgi:hypothetical protein
VRQLIVEGIVRGQLSIVHEKASGKLYVVALVPKAPRNAQYRRVLEMREVRLEGRRPIPLATFSDLGSRAMATTVRIAPNGAVVAVSRYALSNTVYRSLRQLDRLVAKSNDLEQEKQRLQRRLSSSSASPPTPASVAELRQVETVFCAVQRRIVGLRAKIHNTVTAKHFQIANDELRPSSVHVSLSLSLSLFSHDC